MAAIADPIGANLVKDLKKPGGNITGVSDRIQLNNKLNSSALTPNVKQSESLTQAGRQFKKLRLKNLRLMLKKAGLTVETFAVPSTNEIAQQLM